MTNFKYWLKGIRFYIAIGIFMVSLEAWWFTNSVYSGSSLSTIRLVQIYAWLSVGLLGIALSIGPFYKLFPNVPCNKLFKDARRMLGIGSAWFALLHSLIAYFVLFKSMANPFKLPAEYKAAFFIGLIALIILLAMALTSFDGAFNKMGIWWFRLHRLVYVAAALIILHGFIISNQATNAFVITVLVVFSFILFSFHTVIIRKKRKHLLLNSLSLIGIALIMIFIFRYGINQHIFNNYIQTKPPEGPISL